MGIVKLALAGLDGVQQSRVELGSAVVIYDGNQIRADAVALAVTHQTGFDATVRTDEPYDPTAQASPPRKCLLSWLC